MIAKLCLAVLAVGAAQAGTVITISNDIYNNCGGDYCSGGPYSLMVSMTIQDGTDLDNLSFAQGPLNTGTGGNIEPDVTSFTLSDGSGFTITNLNATAEWFNIATDGSGNVTAWYINVASAQGNFETYWFPSYPQVYYDSNQNGFGSDSCFEFDVIPLSGTTCQGSASSESTSPSGAPEPSAMLLTPVGLIALAAVRRRIGRRTAGREPVLAG